MSRVHSMTAILPCNDMKASAEFYKKLGFINQDGDDEYRILSDGKGGDLHLQRAVEGWWFRDAIRSDYTSTPSMWMSWPRH